jgi:NADH:ubiquinone oxidoreductase subunit E
MTGVCHPVGWQAPVLGIQTREAMNTAVLPPLKDLDPEVQEEIDDCVERWSDQEGNLIMILHEIQNHHGYVPREASLLLAEKTGVPLARIYEVLTFYHYFRLVPQGKHTITVCNGTACYLKGSARLLAELEGRLGIKEGQTTEASPPGPSDCSSCWSANWQPLAAGSPCAAPVLMVMLLPILSSR